MDWSVPALLIDSVIPWLCFSLLVYVCTAYLTKKQNSSPHIWWWALAVSFVPLLPFSFNSLQLTLPQLHYFDIESAHIATQASIAQINLNKSDLLSTLCLLVYVAFTVFKLLQFTVTWRKLKHLSQTTVDIDCISITKIATVISQAVHSPFVFGITKPKIVLPKYFSSLEVTQQQILLQHELTHIINKDHIAIVSWRMLSIFLWFNPLIKKMELQFVRAMEHRCDNLTIKRFDINKQVYAATLLESLKRAKEQQDNTFVAQFNSAALSFEDYKTRLMNIVSSTGENQVVVMTKCFALMLLLSCSALFVKQTELIASLVWQQPLSSFKVSSPFSSVSKIRNYQRHQGIDYIAKHGSTVLAAADGIVIVADAKTLNANYGKTVMLQHKAGYQTLYAHLESIMVTSGSWVRAGQPLGIIGETGKATGVHLHFEVIKDNQRLDPTMLLQK